MDKFVRVYSGGELVKGPNGVEFGDLFVEGIWFETAPTYGELIEAVYRKLGLEPATHNVRMQGRTNVGGGAHRHFIMVPISDDVSWSNYVKAVFNGTDWNCLEVYVQEMDSEPVDAQCQNARPPKPEQGASLFTYSMVNAYAPTVHPHYARLRKPRRSTRTDSPSSRKDSESSSQSESDAKSEDREHDSFAYTLHQKVFELEDELNAANLKLLDANEKLEFFEEKSLRCHCDYKENGNGADQATKIADIEGELTLTREKLESSQEEINDLQRKLENAAILSEERSMLLEQNKGLEAEIVNLNEEIASTIWHFEDKLSENDAEISRYRQELAAASEKLLQEKSTNSAEVDKLQETIQSARYKLEEFSEEKSLAKEQAKELEEAYAEAEWHRQELIHAAEMLSEDKFRHEAEILMLRQSMEDLKPEFKRIAKYKALVEELMKHVEETSAKAEKHMQELIHAAEMPLEIWKTNSDTKPRS